MTKEFDLSERLSAIHNMSLQELQDFYFVHWKRHVYCRSKVMLRKRISFELHVEQHGGYSEFLKQQVERIKFAQTLFDILNKIHFLCLVKNREVGAQSTAAIPFNQAVDAVNTVNRWFPEWKKQEKSAPATRNILSFPECENPGFRRFFPPISSA